MSGCRVSTRRAPKGVSRHGALARRLRRLAGLDPCREARRGPARARGDAPGRRPPQSPRPDPTLRPAPRAQGAEPPGRARPGSPGLLAEAGIAYTWLAELGNPQRHDRSMAVLRDHLEDTAGDWPVHRGLERLAAHPPRRRPDCSPCPCACGDGRTQATGPSSPRASLQRPPLRRAPSALRERRVGRICGRRAGPRAARIAAEPGAAGSSTEPESPESEAGHAADVGRLTVRLVAAGVAAAAVGLPGPGPPTLAQKPDTPAAQSSAEPQVPESHRAGRGERRTWPSPARPELRADPRPPVLPTPA